MPPADIVLPLHRYAISKRDVQGAAGGLAINAASAAGNGGHTTAPLTVNPGTTYHIAVGAKGHTTGATLQAELAVPQCCRGIYC